MIISDKDLRDMIIYAFRYALGRRSYSSDTMSHVICVNWSEFSDHDKQLFIREINQAIEQGLAGDECDVNTWSIVLDMVD